MRWRRNGTDRHANTTSKQQKSSGSKGDPETIFKKRTHRLHGGSVAKARAEDNRKSLHREQIPHQLFHHVVNTFVGGGGVCLNLSLRLYKRSLNELFADMGE